MELIIIKISYLVQGGIVLLILMIAYKAIKALMFSQRMVAKRLLKYGSKAQAKVLSIEKVADERNGKANVKLLLQVEPELGRSFVAEILTSIDASRFNILQTGGMVSVMYNPVNREQVVLAPTML
ncbi:hypothetical protein [Dyadobacter sp. CY323]|uniref:hypothetical protein n=1 Tax=Dyadobacter sp. CY323 TaxID=2907302 RepID=UPI001F258BC6|nr:hypothetical protein [Dyadobacter sp. CY323]MCE6991025.1 hypothetical protein [Dyadobacter sp. CY323]